MIDRLLQIIAPHHCFECGKTGDLLCQNCKYDIVEDTFSGCIVCERPTASGICSACRTTYSKAWCVGDRTGSLLQLINVYKFERAKAAGSYLADLLDASLPVLPPDTIVVPVPTVPSHIRVRGYDHALLLARLFAKKRTLRTSTCLKRYSALSQRGLNKNERLKLAEKTYTCKTQLDSSVPYLLIDDVVTTNATLRFAARALQDAGATEVWVAVIARQPLDKQG